MQAFSSDGLFDDIYLRAEQLGELEFHIFEATEIVKASVRKTSVEADGEVDVAGMRLIPGGRAEERNADDTFGAEFLLAGAQGSEDFVTVHGSILPKRRGPVNIGSHRVGADSGCDQIA